MSFWDRFFGRKGEGGGNSYYPWVPDFLVRPSKSGAVVNADTALEVTAVMACVRVIANGVAQVPLKLYRERPDGGADIAKDHPLYRVIHDRPNPWQTSFAWRETLMYHVVLTGDAYCFKNKAGGQIKELIPFDPSKVEPRQAPDMTITYRVTGADGTQKDFPAEAIWHLRGPSWDSWRGMDAVKKAREAIGLAMVAEETQALFHKNGAQTTGTYSVEGALSDKQYEQLSKWLGKQIGGDAKHRPLILDRNAKYLPTQMSGVDAQHLETRKFQIEEICRAFGVIPLMAGYSDKTATYASAEQMFIAHVVHTLGPWYARFEQALKELIEEDDVYARFVVAGLMRGAAKDRGEYLSKALGAGNSRGWMTQNEVRALDEMNPLPGGYDLPQPSAAAQPAANTNDPNADPSAPQGA